MKHLTEFRRARFFPPIPAEIVDDFAIIRATRVRSQTPLLFLTLFLTTPAAIYAASPGAWLIVQVGLPVIMGAACLLGFADLMRTRNVRISPRRARRMVSEAIWVSGSLAVVCSAWCTFSWLGAPAETRIYYPMIVSMGSLATAYCLSTMRAATIVNLGIGLIPMSVLLLTSGSRLDLAAGVALFVATALLLRMIFQQHDQLVDLLMLQRRMHALANTDPLTGLLNRRAFDERLDTEIHHQRSDAPFTLALLDLDGFKPINDRFGHATGDRLLREVAARLAKTCGSDALVARLGGDEFAVLVPRESSAANAPLADLLLTALVPPCVIDGQPIRVGASVGLAHFPVDGSCAGSLLNVADTALYAAKGRALAGASPLPRLNDRDDIAAPHALSVARA